MAELTRTITHSVSCVIVAAAHIVIIVMSVVASLYLDNLLRANGDPKLYDTVPWRYLLDTADVALIGTLIIFGTWTFKKVLQIGEEK